jgi:hypothetical protein
MNVCIFHFMPLSLSTLLYSLSGNKKNYLCCSL